MKTVLIAQFKHETNTYINKATNIEDFRARNLAFGEDVILRYKGTETALGGFINVLEKAEDIKVLPVIAADAMPSGIVEENVWDLVMNELVLSVRNNRVDGVLIAFHGAMVADGHDDAEGDMIERLRDEIGDKTPICITLDYHANITEKMASNSTLIFPYDNYPHIDMLEKGVEAAENLLKILKGTISPILEFKKLDLLYPLIESGKEPHKFFLDKALEYEKNSDVISVSVVSGFAYSDIYESGACVIAQTNGNEKLAKNIAEDLSNFIWERRQRLYKKIMEVKEAVEAAIKHEGTILLADVLDNAGAGFGSDSTTLIKELIDRKAEKCIVATVYDPETVQQACNAGVGKTVRISLGGKTSNKIGAPIVADAHVKMISDGLYVNKGEVNGGLASNMGTTAVLIIKGITIIVSSLRVQPFDAEVFRAHRIEPTEAKIIVLKSSVHFRADFTPLVKEIIEVETPNVCPWDISKLRVKKSRRPICPIDNI